MKKYAVKEVFSTIQGEGFWTGTPAVFVRFAGCNMWSGEDEDRERDAARTGAPCPTWCDTDFRADTPPQTADDIAERVLHVFRGQPLLVITGGEPLLQLDDVILAALSRAVNRNQVAIETNGSVAPRWTFRFRPWITLSPKVPRAACALTRANEIKVIYPYVDPMLWSDFEADHRFVQPADDAFRTANLRRAVDFVREHPSSMWRLGLQTHKLIGVP